VALKIMTKGPIVRLPGTLTYIFTLVNTPICEFLLLLYFYLLAPFLSHKKG
jgi:hypothetical protein